MAYVFAAPLVLIIFGLVGFPIVKAVWLSFHNQIRLEGDAPWVGARNYQQLWTDSAFRSALQTTLNFAVISVFVKFWVGLSAALLVHNMKRYRAVFTGLILLPWIVPEAVAAFTWRGLYQPTFGGLNVLLKATGIMDMIRALGFTGTELPFISDARWAMPSVIAVNVWKGIPFFTITLLSGLKSIDAGLYDAAAVDGANAWQRFVNITLPGLRYVIIVASLLSMIFTLNAFGLVYIMTGGGPLNSTRLFSILTYELFAQNRYSRATTVAMAIVPALLVLIVILGRYMRGDVDREEKGAATSFAPIVVGAVSLLAILALRVYNLWQPADVTFLLSCVGIAAAAIIASRFWGVVVYWALPVIVEFSGFMMLLFTLSPTWLAIFMVGLLGVAFVMQGDRFGMTQREVTIATVRTYFMMVGLSGLSAVVFGLNFTVVAVVLLTIFQSGLIDKAMIAMRGSGASGPKMRSAGAYRANQQLGTLGRWLALGLLLLFELFPFYWVFVTAFKSQAQITALRSVFWPDPWTFENFRYMLQDTKFLLWFKNTITVATVSCILSVIIGALGAYALVRLKWRGAGGMSTAVLFTYLMPGIIIFIPLFQIFSALNKTFTNVLPAFLYADRDIIHLVNGLGALMVAYPTFGLPFACWLLMGYYRSIPAELEEAALIDGCNYFQAFFRVILPLTAPALLTVALFALTGAFNDFLFAFIFVRSEQYTTLAVGLSQMVIGDIFPFGRMMAASIMMAIPVTAVYMLAQRFMVDGLTAGSVKG